MASPVIPANSAEVRLSALEAEAMVASSKKVKPFPLAEFAGVQLNPLGLPANWSQEIVLRTRWQTDKTRPVGSNRTERWALKDRPQRTLEVTITGLSREESHVLQQAATKHTYEHGHPFPLYPDAVESQGADGLRIQGDFRRRRFFEGARVFVMPGIHTKKRSDNDVFVATIEEISPTECVIDAAPRTITSRDMIIPAIDVERIEPPSTEAITDGVVETTYSVNELEGGSTLPALWPPVAPENAEVLEAFCEVVDDRAIFPFDPNWAGGVSITPVTDLDTTTTGRGSVKEVDGLPYHSIELSIMGWDRERTWSVLRFFDSMQGRSGSFYLIHPLKPWRPFSGGLVPSTTQCRIEPIGDADSIPKFFRRIVLTRANGERVTRIVESISDNGDHFALVFSGNPLPDTDFVEVQPIMVCNFDQDEIEEVWSTTEVARELRLRIVEAPDAGTANATNLSQIQYGIFFPGLRKYGGLNCLFKAGVGCLDQDGAPAEVWPSVHCFVGQWRDMSNPTDRQESEHRIDRTLYQTLPGPTLVKVPGPYQNNGESTMLEPLFFMPSMLDSGIPASQKRLWTSQGWTLVIVLTPCWFRLNLGADRFVVQLERPGFQVFNLYAEKVTGGPFPFGWGVRYADESQTQREQLFSLDLHRSDVFYDPIILVFHADPVGGLLRGWANGIPLWNSGQGICTGGLMMASSDYSAANFFGGLATGVTPSVSNILWQYDNIASPSLMASFDRALSISEVNEIYETLSDSFGSTIAAAALY